MTRLCRILTDALLAASPRLARQAVLLVSLLLWEAALCGAAAAEPVRMRHAESTSHGVLMVTDTANKPLAYGELIQQEEAQGNISSRMVIRFKDGSLYDETVRFSQRPLLRLLDYKLSQRGPSFAEASEVSFDRSGHYNARVQKSGEDEEKASGSMSVPEDASNGLSSLVLKNLAPGASATTHLIAFTPKPQVLELHFAPEGSDQFLVGSIGESATRFIMEPKVPGVLGVLASVAGKQPPKFRMWLTPDPAPALLKFEGPLYPDGPTWRIGPSAPRWKE